MFSLDFIEESGTVIAKDWEGKGGGRMDRHKTKASKQIGGICSGVLQPGRLTIGYKNL
jgi:hypothetical protein